MSFEVPTPPSRRIDQRAWTLVRYHAGQARRWARIRADGAAAEPRAVFLFGQQRSGTNMIMRALGACPRVMVFNEHPMSAAFTDYRIRNPSVTRRLVRLSGADVALFKPLCDTQWADRLLDVHPGSRALWAFRHFHDAANSAVVKWGEHQREILRGLATGELSGMGWRGERYHPEDREMAQRVYRDDMTPAEAACAHWALRNALAFRLGLDRDPRVLWVRYEDLVAEPTARFARIFDFLDLPFDPDFVGAVHARSVGRDASPELSPAVRELCEGMLERLEATYRAQLDA